MTPVILVAFLLLVGQLLMTLMSLSTQQADTRQLTIINMDTSKESRQLIDTIQQSSSLSVIEKRTLSHTDITSIKNDGILVIHPNFKQHIQDHSHPIADFYSGSGNRDIVYLKELILSSLLTIKGEQTFQHHLDQLDLLEKDIDVRESSPKLHLNYHYTLSDSSNDPQSTIPIGVISATLLFSFLTLVYFLSDDKKKWRFYSKKRILHHNHIVFSLILAIWMSEILLFFWLLPVLTNQVTYSIQTVITLLALEYFILSASLLSVALCPKQTIYHLFIPWFLLNLTLGGGLWDYPAVTSWWSILIPLSQAVTYQPVPLLIGGITCHLLFLIVILNTRKWPKIG